MFQKRAGQTNKKMILDNTFKDTSAENPEAQRQQKIARCIEDINFFDNQIKEKKKERSEAYRGIIPSVALLALPPISGGFGGYILSSPNERFIPTLVGFFIIGGLISMGLLDAYGGEHDTVYQGITQNFYMLRKTKREIKNIAGIRDSCKRKLGELEVEQKSYN